MPTRMQGHYLRIELPNGKIKNFRSPTYQSYRMMKERCYNQNRENSQNYIKLGIQVCDRWMAWGGVGFENFLADMGVRPEGMTLDRIDPFGDYTPENCRWATAVEQAQNKRKNVVK